MENEGPDKEPDLTDALQRRVDHLELSAAARSRLLASAQSASSTGISKTSRRVWVAVAACLAIGGFAIVWHKISHPSLAQTRFKCVSVEYARGGEDEWSKRTVIVRETNGKESYIKVVAYRPPEPKPSI